MFDNEGNFLSDGMPLEGLESLGGALEDEPSGGMMRLSGRIAPNCTVFCLGTWW